MWSTNSCWPRAPIPSVRPSSATGGSCRTPTWRRWYGRWRSASVPGPESSASTRRTPPARSPGCSACGRRAAPTVRSIRRSRRSGAKPCSPPPVAARCSTPARNPSRLPTAFWHELVNYLFEEGAPLPECVRLVIIGGEAANPARLADWYALPAEHARLVNTYGCTETTLITHAIDLHGPLAAHRRDQASRVPIGRPLPHVLEHVTDEGELLIGGPSLAAGYRGLPEATDARFVTVGAHRFFRTGDRVTRLPDGTLVHEGRVDDEVKIRGIRVDPAEVEAHIASHPAV